jgi:hypothetical protein
MGMGHLYPFDRLSVFRAAIRRRSALPSDGAMKANASAINTPPCVADDCAKTFRKDRANRTSPMECAILLRNERPLVNALLNHPRLCA